MSLEDSSRSWLIRNQDGRILRVSLAEMFDNTIPSNLHTGDTQPGPDKVKLLHILFRYRVFPSNKQKQNWKIDTSLGAIGAQNLFSSLYKLGVNLLWIREI